MNHMTKVVAEMKAGSGIGFPGSVRLNHTTFSKISKATEPRPDDQQRRAEVEIRIGLQRRVERIEHARVSGEDLERGHDRPRSIVT